MQNAEQQPEKKQVLLREGLFHRPETADEKPYLIGSKCSVCGNVFFPARAICPVCVAEDTLKEIPIGTRGKLNGFATVQVAPEGFTAPYTLSFIDLSEGPTIFAIIAGEASGEETLYNGMEMELTIESISTDENGNEVIGYKYSPAESVKP